MNIEKTKTMVFGCRHIERHIEIDNRRLKNVEHFVYLGSILTWDNDCNKDVRARIANAKSVMVGFNNIWRSKQISFRRKIRIIIVFVFSAALYAWGSWTLKKTDKDKILAFEMYRHRRMLHLSWTQRIKNTEIRDTLCIREDFSTDSNEEEANIVRTHSQNE